jgi:hypothetical protein
MDMKTGTILNANLGFVPLDHECALITDDRNRITHIQVDGVKIPYSRKIYEAPPGVRKQMQEQNREALGLSLPGEKPTPAPPATLERKELN